MSLFSVSLTGWSFKRVVSLVFFFSLDGLLLELYLNRVVNLWGFVSSSDLSLGMCLFRAFFHWVVFQWGCLSLGVSLIGLVFFSNRVRSPGWSLIRPFSLGLSLIEAVLGLPPIGVVFLCGCLSQVVFCQGFHCSYVN